MLFDSGLGFEDGANQVLNVAVKKRLPWAMWMNSRGHQTPATESQHEVRQAF